MARRGDLAGLAALGALGYMLSKGNKSTAEGGGPAVTARPTATPADMASEEDPMEAANKRVERTLIPNQRGEAGTSETVFPSNRARPATGAVPRLINRTPPQGGSGGGRGPTAEELAAYTASRQPARSAGRSGADQIPTGGPAGWTGGEGERVTGNEFTRNASNTANALAGMTGAGAVGPALRSMQNAGMYGKVGTRPGMAQQAIGAAERQALSNNPTRQITGPSKGELVARDRAARAAQRQQAMGEENAARYNLDPSAPGYAEQAANIRNNLGGSDFSLPLKRGGKVKAKPKKMASGGMARSGASKRADGIATKGKTRGRIC